MNCSRWIALVLGLTFGVPALAQTAPGAGGPILTDATGTVSFRVGTGAPQTLVKGQSIPLGARIVTGDGSSAELTFPDGQVVAMGSRSRVIIREFRYLPNDIDKSRVVLNITDGGVRIILGAIGQHDPGLIQLQFGTKTTAQTPYLPRGGDLGIVMLGNSTLVQVNQGRVGLRVAGETYPLAAGDAAFVQADGYVRLGGLARLETQPGQSAEDRAVFDQYRAMQRLAAPRAAQTILTLSSPPYDEKREEEQTRAAGLPLPPQPVTNSLSTSATGAVGGGTCGASCN